MKLNTKPLKDIEIGFPVVADGTYFAKVLKKDVVPNKAGTGNNLLIQVQILDDKLIKRDGTQIENRGQLKLTRYIGLVPSDSYDPNTMIKELAIASGKDKDSEDDFDTDDIAEFLKVKLTYKAPEGQYQEGNDVSRFYPIKDTDNFTPPAF